jgi:hypothetical protein
MVGRWHDPAQKPFNHCTSDNDRRVTHPRPSFITSTFNFLYCTVVSRKSIRFTRMPSNARRAAWHFDALLAVPAPLFRSPALIDKKCLLEELDSLLKRDLVKRPTFPTYTSNVELKLKLSDLEVVLANACTKLPVTGYIQSAPHYNIDSGNLLRWFEANRSPVDGQLVPNCDYCQWSQMDPAYRHAQVAEVGFRAVRAGCSPRVGNWRRQFSASHHM